MEQFAVGIDLGGTAIKAGLVKKGYGLVNEVSVATEAEQGPAHVLDRIATAVNLVSRFAPDYQVEGVGIGAPGAIDWGRTTVLYPPNLPGWGKVNLQEELRRRLRADLPVFVENDANLAGLGSAHYGAGKPYDAFIMVTLGTGVGGAIIYNNRIFRGTSGGAGEIGHMSIDYEGVPDRYGIAGAIEAYVGQRFLSHYARHRLLSYTESKVHAMAGDDLIDITPRMLSDAADQGDEHAREVLEWAGHKLGCVLASAINLLDIPTVIVGGGVSAAGDYILAPTRKTIPQYVMPSLRERIQVVRETLGNEVGTLGAAHLVFEFLDDQPPIASRLQS